MRAFLLGFCGVALLSGCSTLQTSFPTPRYGSTVQSALPATNETPLRVAVGEAVVTEAGLDTNCAYGREVVAPDGGSFAEYLRNAVIFELSTAGIYDPDASTVIQPTLRRADLDLHGKGAGDHWELYLTLVSSNGASMEVSHTEPVHGHRQIRLRCEAAAQGLELAMSETLRRAIASPSFPSLVETWEKPWRGEVASAR